MALEPDLRRLSKWLRGGAVARLSLTLAAAPGLQGCRSLFVFPFRGPPGPREHHVEAVWTVSSHVSKASQLVSWLSTCFFRASVLFSLGSAGIRWYLLLYVVMIRTAAVESDSLRARANQPSEAIPIFRGGSTLLSVRMG